MKIFITLLVTLVFSACTINSLAGERRTTHNTPMYSLTIAADMPPHYIPLIKAVVENGLPSDVDKLLILNDTCGGSACAREEGGLYIVRMPVNLTNAEFAGTLGHELAHFDPDIRALPSKRREIACDIWGIMTVIDLGLDPQARIAMVRNRNIPESAAHPSDAERAIEMEKAVVQYKKK